MATRFLRKIALDCKTGKKLKKKFISQRGRRKNYNDKYSKENALRKEKSGAYSKGESV